MEFDYTVKTNKSFDQAVGAVGAATDQAGFKVLHIHDLKKTLGAKGFEIEPFKIIEVCNARAAAAVLQADLKIGLCLPCKINVYLHNNTVYISGLRPTILPQFFPEANLGTLPEEVDAAIRQIIDTAATG